MARQRNPKRDEAHKLYNDSGGKIKLTDIAKKLDVPASRVRKWKSEDQWERSDSKQKERSDSKHENDTKKKLLESVDSNDELTEKRKLFCLYFADCLNATQAYLKAFGGKRIVAASEGYKLLRIPCVKAEIDRLKQIKYESIMLQADDIVERQMRIAFADMSDFIDISIKKQDIVKQNGDIGTIKYNNLLIKESTELDGAVIQEVKATKDGVSIKLKDSQKAFDWLTKYFEFNPQDRHRIAFDNARLEIERKKAAMNDVDKENATVVKLVIDEP